MDPAARERARRKPLGQEIPLGSGRSGRPERDATAGCLCSHPPTSAKNASPRNGAVLQSLCSLSPLPASYLKKIMTKLMLLCFWQHINIIMRSIRPRDALFPLHSSLQLLLSPGPKVNGGQYIRCQLPRTWPSCSDIFTHLLTLAGPLFRLVRVHTKIF